VTSKLTLSVDPAVISRAKRYAKQRGVSISRMVETYLASVSTPPAATDVPPVLRSLRGTLKRADLKEYRKHLIEKYR
jgi:hypothetical protein